MENNKEIVECDKLFVGGDLTGIQKFLYNITSYKAAVSLKGRSAFLTMYLREVCSRIEAAIAAAGDRNYDELYCSGGKFYLITQNTEAIVQAIDNCTKDIIEELWEEHKGQLGLNICHVAFRECKGEFIVKGHEDEQNKNSGVLWKCLNAEFARQKNQKFKDLLISNFAAFFIAQGAGVNTKVCAVTGVEDENCVFLKKENGEARFVLPSVKEQIDKGQELSRKNSKGETKTFEDYADGSSLGILRMDVDGLGKRFVKGFPTIAEYKKFSEKVKDFFENYIGGGNGRFEGKKLLDTIVPNTRKKYSEYLNVIYAGGDDLFIVGRWDRLIDFAELIHKETEECFKDDCYEDDGERRYISISGGIAIVKPKFPIAKAAELAGEAEDASKQIDGKNAFNLFGKTVKWNGEFAKVKEYKDRFVEYVRDKDVEFNKSILHKLMLYSTLADINKMRKRELDTMEESRCKNALADHEESKVVLDYRYVWHKAYYLTRFMEKYKNFNNEKDPVKREKKKIRWDFCHELRDESKEKVGNSGRFLELIAIAARWAELELKIIDNN